MFGIEWARASQFNWTFDNCGGTPIQEVICGLWSGVKFTVQDGKVVISQAVGGGRVYYLRGVWKTDALFAWGGFWVDPEAGDTNYYTGGSFVNSGNSTVITLGTPLADGTEVQAYYIYNTGERAAKYDALNSVPCMRPAWRSATDYTYDFAVDRIFDAMAAVYFAYREQGLDTKDILEFFWGSYIAHAASNGNPMVFDTFERQWFDRGNYLIYANTSHGVGGFAKFGPELPPAAAPGGRALRMRPAYYRGPAFSAWFGYGFNWDLTQPYLDTISKVRFKIRGAGSVSRVQRCIKTAGAGAANLILVDGFDLAQVRYYVITVTKAGPPGTAEATLAVYDGNLKLLNDVAKDDGIDGENIICPSSTNPVNLGHGLQAFWQDGSLAVGDTWLITCGGQEIKPHRLQVILNDSKTTAGDAFGEAHTFVHGLPDHWTDWKELELGFEQFWRLGNIIDCRDRKPGRWGNWSVHNVEYGEPYEVLFYDIQAEETINGEVFYTKQRFTWNLDSTTLLALGFYVGIPNDVNSTGRTNINYLLRHYLGTDTTFRTKVRDANGNYFYHDDVIPPHEWVRVSINLSSLLPENGGTLTHPLTLVDVGIASAPPAQGSFDLIDLKFDNHLTFAGSNNLRLVEFKYSEGSVQLTGDPDWYLDDFGFDLAVADPYPYVPRLALSLNAYGRNPWRGPTLVHYSHPLAPFLVNRHDIQYTELALHKDAQDEFTKRYGGLPGPILPVHSRNDIENIALCGEENFNRFNWWPRYRNYGKDIASWRFNETLTDALGTHTFTMTTGSPVWTTGICQPGNTALSFNGTTKHATSDGTDFHLDGDFTIEVVGKANVAATQTIVSKWDQIGNKRSWVFYLLNNNYLSFGWSTTGADYYVIISDLRLPDADYHHFGVARKGNVLTFFLDGVTQDKTLTDTIFNAVAPLRLGSTQGSWPGYLNGAIDYLAIHKGRAFSTDEIVGRYRVAFGLENSSAYPEVGYCLGQFWSFYRLGEYYFVSNDAAAWELLDKWLNWFQATVVPVSGTQYKFPIWFSEYGYVYDTNSAFSFDAGAAASIVIGCLYIYMRNGDARALDLAQKLLQDLRENRASGDYGGYLYKSDYHYAWLNALVAHAFGLAVVGRAGAAYRYPYTAADEIHYQNMMNNFWAMSGDTKPNLLNQDLIPYHDAEPHDIWDYAPHYLFMKEMGSMEGVVLMLHAALDWALYTRNWHWFTTLLAFMVRLSGAVLSHHQIFSVRAHHVTSNLATKVNVTYGNYRRDHSCFVEDKDQGLIDLLGERRQVIPLHYGSPVITEDATTAAKIARRALAYFATPKEMVQVVADLSALRLDLNDMVKINSPFHGYSLEPFALHRRAYDPRNLRVTLELMRPSNYAPSWALDVAGSDYDSYAVDAGSDLDQDWQFRAFGY